MRPSKRPVKPIAQAIETMTVPQLRDLLASNTRTINNPSLFPQAQSSTTPPDPILQKLLDSNARIRARLGQLQVDEVGNLLTRTGLDGQIPLPAAGTAVNAAGQGDGIVKVQRGGVKVLSAPHSNHLLTLEASRLASLSQPTAPTVRHSDELGEIERAARLNSFMRYTASDSDLEWDSGDDDEEDEGEEWEGVVTSTPPTGTPLRDANGHGNGNGNGNGGGGQGEEVDEGGLMDVDIGEIIRVDVERIEGSGGLRPPG